MSDETRTDTRPNFEGHAERECGEHRTAGPHRAWCFDCTEWCSATAPCKGCEVPQLLDEIERLRSLTEGDPTSIYAEAADLRAWKASAMSVLAAWDRVFTALGEPGPFGGSKAANALAEVERLRAENERLREALREAARLALTVHDLIDHWSECPAPPDAGCGECHNYYAAVAALRASLSETGGEAEAPEREWYCEAIAVGLADAGTCSPERPIHNAPCGWTGGEGA